MNIPESMKAELAAWGIDLESWVGCEGNFRLAVGYAAIFWPQFVAFEGYILRADFSVDSLRGFEAQQKGDRASVEAVMNHLHIADIQQFGCPDISKDKVLLTAQRCKKSTKRSSGGNFLIVLARFRSTCRRMTPT